MTTHRPPPEGWLDVDDGPLGAAFHSNKETKMLKGWKTLIFSAATALLGVASTMDWTSVLAGPWGGWVMTGVGIAGAVLRTVTTTPVGQK